MQGVRPLRAQPTLGVMLFVPVLFWCAAPPDTACGAESVLLVPASDAVQYVTVDWPKDLGDQPVGGWQLAETAAPDQAVAVQRTARLAADGTVASETGALLATLPPRAGAEETRRWALRRSSGAEVAAAFRFEELNDKSLKLLEGDRPVWVYNHGVITDERVPQQDQRRSRACYVHPVWGLNGEIVTDDFPRDHYHHHGIFWAWPHVSVAGQEYDLWTYAKIQPRFVRWLYRQAGPVAAVLAVENGWFVGDQQVMTERVWLRAFRSAADERSLEVTLVLIPGDQPVTLRGAEGKSYGGLTMRFNVWPRKDATVRAPGHTVRQSGGDSLASTEDLSNTRLPWADLCAQFPDCSQRSGGAIFVRPDHPDHPPSWLTRCYGCMCVGYPGVEARTFPAGQPFRLDYRIWLHRDEVEHPRLESAYAAYGAGAKAHWAATE